MGYEGDSALLYSSKKKGHGNSVAFLKLVTSSLVCRGLVAPDFHTVVLEFLQMHEEYLARRHASLLLAFPQIPLGVSNGLSCRGNIVVPGTARQQQGREKNDSLRHVFLQADLSDSSLDLTAIIYLGWSLPCIPPILYPSFAGHATERRGDKIAPTGEATNANRHNPCPFWTIRQDWSCLAIRLNLA